MSVDWRLGLAPDTTGGTFNAFMQGQQARREDDGRNALSAYAADPNPANLNALAPHNPEFVMQEKQRQAEQDKKAAEQKLIGDALTGNPEARQALAYHNSDLYMKLGDQDKAKIDTTMKAIGQTAFSIMQLPKEQQEPALQQALKGLQAQGFDTSSFHLTGNPDVDLRTALAITGQLDDFEKFAQPRYVPKSEFGMAGFQYGKPIMENGQPKDFAPSAQPSGQLPRVNSPEEARKLPPGSMFLMPDGRIGTVPGGASGNAGGGFRPMSDARSAVKQVFPKAQITDWKRPANSSLGRANPDSFHVTTGAAVDMAPIPGMTFQQAVERFARAGYKVHRDSRDEVNNPSGHATGPHWHFVLGE